MTTLDSTEKHHGFRVERDDAVATVIIDNGPVNTLDPAFIEAMITGLSTVLDDRGVRCVVIRGKDRIFIGGADLTVMRNLDSATYQAMRRWVVVQRMLELAPKPVIAALNGHTLGGGAELSLACDLRILQAQARFGFPESGLGILPGAGGSQRLPRLVGPHVAKRLMMDGAKLTADEALAAGLVDIVAGHDFEEVVAREATRLAALPTATLGLIKQAVAAGIDLPIDEATKVEGEYVERMLHLEDAAEGIQAFLDKREPRFVGR